MSSLNITSHHCSCHLRNSFVTNNGRFHTNKMRTISFCGHTASTSGLSGWKLHNRPIFSISCALDDTISPDDSEDDKESESTKPNSEETANYSQVYIIIRI